MNHEGHHVRALARGVEGVAVGIRPALGGIVHQGRGIAGCRLLRLYVSSSQRKHRRPEHAGREPWKHNTQQSAPEHFCLISRLLRSENRSKELSIVLPRKPMVLRSIPVPLPVFWHRPAFAIDRACPEAVQPQTLSHNLRDHHLSYRAAKTLMQPKAEMKLITLPPMRIEVVRFGHSVGIEHSRVCNSEYRSPLGNGNFATCAAPQDGILFAPTEEYAHPGALHRLPVNMVGEKAANSIHASAKQ